MSTIQVNGKTYNIPSGKSISIVNGVVTVDGKPMKDGPDMSGIATLKVEGSLTSLTTDMSVNCNNVSGDVNAGQHVNCKSIGGNVRAGGHVNANTVHGSIKL